MFRIHIFLENNYIIIQKTKILVFGGYLFFLVIHNIHTKVVPRHQMHSFLFGPDVSVVLNKFTISQLICFVVGLYHIVIDRNIFVIDIYNTLLS